ncbi:DUF3304 domain-containing protein [Pseudogulbenkiania ferrooxidans]|uniref:DUF3304 domain-containing protein n=1 Tax=Pseudogulbenkiania ferrooxidans TaxID=549169 RepID=UPI001F16CA30|nr:DUF3304 domain-containing protein [Pseudogulbenkiania ferrooxidans]
MLLLNLPFLAGCKEDTTALSYLAVNHTDKSVLSITINGQGGILNASAMGGGGKEVCCVVVPSKWRPGLTATIGWENDGDWLRDKNGQPVIRDGKKVYVPAPWKTRTVPIPQYTENDMGHFDIHFLPNDQVMVKVSYLYPHHPDYRPAYPQENKESVQ